MSEQIDHVSSGGWGFDHQFVHPGRVFPSIDLRDPPYTDEPIRVTLQHEFLERAYLVQVALLCGPKDPLSQVTNSPVGLTPIDGVPIGLFLGSVCRACVCLHLTFPLISPHNPRSLGDAPGSRQPPFSVGMSILGPICPVMSSCCLICWQPSLLDPSCSH
jgi:hypothetical protein